MNLTDELLGETWYWAAWAVWIPVFAQCVLRAPWRRLQDAEHLNVWLGMIVFLTLVWSMKAGVRPGLTFHLLGANLFALVVGPRLAFVGLSLVTLGITVNGAAGPLSFAANALLLGGCGVAISQYLSTWLLRVLPSNFFIYVFINGFMVAGVTVIGIGALSTLLFGLGEVYPWEYLLKEYSPYFILLAFSEAWLSGMVLTLLVVYRPQWVVSFDDSRYLSDK